MSDLSILNGVYANVDQFASLIDEVIEGVGIDSSATPSGAQARLGRLLIDAADHGRSSESYEALVLDSLLRTVTGEPILNLERLGKRLLSGGLDSSDQKSLEILAKGLECERTEVASRLRGRR